MKSCALLRTNVGLTTNIKLVVGSNYSLYLDSIVSTPELAENRFKKYQFNKDDYWDDLVSLFFQNTPADIAYKIKFDDDSDKMSTDFANQYDDLYQYGARNIIDNKFYKEEYEYFAPLYISKTKIPSNFIIFRVDGPGLIKLNKDNFRNEIIKKMKFVKNFDLTLKSNLGQWINNSILNNRYYPNSSLYIDFRRLEFSSWKGIDFERGGYVERNFLLDTTFEYEQLYSEMEKLILEGYKNNKVVFPNIINFSFLFDDTPATPISLRKWTINRYLGFYFDELTLVKKLSPNKLPALRQDVLVDDKNILYSPSSETPFLEDWIENLYPYVEIDGVYYKIEQFEEITSFSLQKVKNTDNTFEEKKTRKVINKYKIISDKKLMGITYSQMNQNLINVSNNGIISYQNGNQFMLNDFESADVWIIQTGDFFHNLIKDDGQIKLFTDYGFNQSVEKFEYYINSPDPNYIKTLDLVTKKDNPPIEFNVYKLKFTDIKDFDTEIIETDYAKFEYWKSNLLTDTDEPKLYVQDLNSNNNPKNNVEFKIQNKVVNIPVSSEYTANQETFRIIDNSLNALWRKNAERLKWGFIGSNSSNDYPYLLNNSFLSEDYNRTCNTKDAAISRERRNLDYFYTVNSESSDYTHHTLHVEDFSNGVINTGFKFEIDKYLGINYDLDYFNYFFGKKTYFENGTLVKQTNKYSYFQSGDTTVPNITLFKGLKFSLYEVDNLNLSDGRIEKINLKNSNKFDGWKFSVLLSENEHIITPSQIDLNTAEIRKSENILRWIEIDPWKHDKRYEVGDFVIHNYTLFKSTTQSMIKDPLVDPYISSDWVAVDEPTIFYSPSFSGFTYSNNMFNSWGSFAPLVYNSGEYYYSDGQTTYDFWKPHTSYLQGDVVTYNNKNWISLTNSNITIPSDTSGYFTNSVFFNTWEQTELQTRWKKVGLWKSDFDYSLSSSWNTSLFSRGNYVIHEDVVYGSTMSPVVGKLPVFDANWNRIYSVVPDTTFFYSSEFTSNPILEMNGKYYKSINDKYPPTPDPTLFYNYSLDNGIFIIINEKFQNVLVNIYVNDNTYSKSALVNTITSVVETRLKNTNRDDLYTTVFEKLSANNFINALNDLSNFFGFSDLIKYIVVGKDSSVKIYDFNNLNSVKNLPYLLTCDSPDEFYVRIKSNILSPKTLQASELKAKRLLNESNIDTLEQINYYNEMHLGSEIVRNLENPVLIPNYSGLKNQIYNVLYRHSGFYSPVLKTIELFDSPSLTQSITNYRFDTELSNFGILKQRIVSKVNRKGNVLKLRNNPNLKSIYPMIDEYGYHSINFFLFKSTWDFEYHFETQEYEPEIQKNSLRVPPMDAISQYFSNNNNKLL